MRISATRLQTYLTCPRKYRFNYVDRIEIPLSASLAFGRVIHDMLHHWFLFEEPVERPYDLAYLTFETLWRETLERDEPVFGKTSPTPDDFEELGRNILTDFIANQRGKPWPLLMEFAFEIAVGEHVLCGIIDRIEAGQTGIVVTDYKTGKQKPAQQEVDGDLQLTIYSFAAEQLFGLPVERVVYYHLRDQTRIESVRYEEDYEKLIHETIPDVAGAIEAECFYPQFGYWCNFCDFREQCLREGLP